MKIIENLKVRFKAQKYNIWTEQIDTKRKADGWLAGYFYANEKIWYGHPLFIFILSNQNNWFKDKCHNGD
jgi:hypothetical protein